MSVVDATALKFDLTRLVVKDAPRTSRNDTAALVVMLPLVVTQCPWGDPKKLETWKRLPLRPTLADVLRQLGAEAQALPDESKGWTFDMQAMSLEDTDQIDAAVFRGAHAAGARMIAKFAIGSPFGKVTQADVLNFGYYTTYRPVLLKLQKEARDEYNAGFLNALIAAPAESTEEPAE